MGSACHVASEWRQRAPKPTEPPVEAYADCSRLCTKVGRTAARLPQLPSAAAGYCCSGPAAGSCGPVASAAAVGVVAPRPSAGQPAAARPSAELRAGRLAACLVVVAQPGARVYLSAAGTVIMSAAANATNPASASLIDFVHRRASTDFRGRYRLGIRSDTI
jgi:hypothetical protein